MRSRSASNSNWKKLLPQIGGAGGFFLLDLGQLFLGIEPGPAALGETKRKGHSRILEEKRTNQREKRNTARSNWCRVGC